MTTARGILQRKSNASKRQAPSSPPKMLTRNQYSFTPNYPPSGRNENRLRRLQASVGSLLCYLAAGLSLSPSTPQTPLASDSDGAAKETFLLLDLDSVLGSENEYLKKRQSAQKI